MEYFLGIDVGTTGCKVVLVNEKGELISKAVAEYPLYTPYPNWAEQDPRLFFLSLHEERSGVFLLSDFIKFINGSSLSNILVYVFRHIGEQSISLPHLLWQ